MSEPLNTEALLRRYREERDRRLRPDGMTQYRPPVGALSRYADDPSADPAFARDPVTDAVDVVVIGGGFGGLIAAARLREAGIDDIRLIEKAADFGGAWYWNRYPGASCDIESYIYLPLLEELGYLPVEKYSRQAEIFAHAKAIGRRFGLYDRALLNTEVTELRWDDGAARWTVSTARGDALRARFVCMSTGPMHRLKLPGIPGIERFKGHAFHTSRWDYAYTGGDAAGGLTGLKDKRVGIIGTGATAVQCVPHLGASAERLYVFQRTPSSIAERNNRPTDPNWAAALTPGWQKARRTNFNTLISGGRQDEDQVADGWTEIIRALGRQQAAQGDAAALRQMADFHTMERIRARVDAVVEDRATAEALKPYYNQFCKRPCFHDEYLQTFNRPNVALIDTQGRGVERITDEAAVVDGKAYSVDCLIFATGFEMKTDYAKRAGYETHGRGGVSQTEAWKDGVSSLHGLHSRGFPNRFILGAAQQANTPNFTHMLDEVSRHVAYIVRHCLDRGVRTVEPSQEAERAWVDHVMSFAEVRRKFDEDCTPGYYNNEGQPSAMTVRNGYYGGGSLAFIKLMEDWRAEGGLQGLEFC